MYKRTATLERGPSTPVRLILIALEAGISGSNPGGSITHPEYNWSEFEKTEFNF